MEILVIITLILVNGFFSLSEVALVSSRISKLEILKKQGYKGAPVALELLKDPGKVLSVVRAWITFIGILTGMLTGLLITDDVTVLLLRFGMPHGPAVQVSMAVTLLLLTFIFIVFGEIIPRTLSLGNPEKVAIVVAPFIKWFGRLFYPFFRLLSISASSVDRIFGITKPTKELIEADLRQLLKTASSEGIIENHQILIHQRLFYFADKKAKHIMTHRREVEWIDLNLPPENLRETILNSKHTRLICCRENLDNFQGVLHVRDYMANCLADDKKEINQLVKQPKFLPESAEAPKVLDLFKKENVNFCVVVNEYGFLEGIITLHDILENLIGSLPEEGETPEPEIFMLDDKSFLVNGDAPVEILDNIFENHVTELENVDYTTVAGFVLEHIDKKPQTGDSFTFLKYKIEIVDIDGNRIDKIRITRE